MLYKGDGLFAVKLARRSSLEIAKKSTDADSRCNRADFESPKFSFEIKSANF